MFHKSSYDQTSGDAVARAWRPLNLQLVTNLDS